MQEQALDVREVHARARHRHARPAVRRRRRAVLDAAAPRTAAASTRRPDVPAGAGGVLEGGRHGAARRGQGRAGGRRVLGRHEGCAVGCRHEERVSRPRRWPWSERPGPWCSSPARATRVRPPRPRPTAATTTGEVERRDLVERETVTGTLGYGDSTPLSSPRQGTITALPAEGTVVERGQTLVEVDGTPVPLLYGSRPFWRALDRRRRRCRRAPARGEPRRTRVRQTRASPSTSTSQWRRRPRSEVAGVARPRGDRDDHDRRDSSSNRGRCGSGSTRPRSAARRAARSYRHRYDPHRHRPARGESPVARTPATRPESSCPTARRPTARSRDRGTVATAESARRTRSRPAKIDGDDHARRPARGRRTRRGAGLGATSPAPP